MRLIKVILFLLIFNSQVYANEYKLVEVFSNLNKPWGMSFIDNDNVLITQKSGDILKINLNTKSILELEHNLAVVDPHWQAGMLDILYSDGSIFVSYTEDRGGEKTSTSIAKGELVDNKIINFKNIFQSEPPVENQLHWGSRLAIKEELLYASVGERALGSVAQDPSNHIGKIIRINTDGSAPEDNPFVNNPDWLPEVYQIGLRNPQGMALNPSDGSVYITNHGPKGGDFFGKVVAGSNYGWMDVAWGGVDYDGSIIGDGSAWKEGLLKPIYRWIPSIAVSNLIFYEGNQFPELKNNIVLTSLKAKKLIKLDFNDGKASNETVLIKGIGRFRDVEQNDAGQIFVIIDDEESGIWELKYN
jgi:quinoprotein glucose dehydrogenase